MEYNFDEIIDRRHTNSAKFDEMDALFGSDVMHLGVADMDYRSPEPILNAMQKIVKKRCIWVYDFTGQLSRFGMSVDATQIS